MNTWLVCASLPLVAGLLPVVRATARGPLGHRVMAQNCGASVVCLVLLLLAQGYGRPSSTGLALVTAVLGPVGTLVFARLLADELDEAPRWAPTVTALTVAATAPVVIASCVATGPGRAAVKVVFVGVLLAGALVAGPVPESAARVGRAFGTAEPPHWTVSGLVLGLVPTALAVGLAAAGVRGPARPEPYGWTKPLRLLHSGHIGDYVVRLLAGITLLGALTLPGVLTG
ncbi:monovalent cation/H+ antiporter complex subunit F [Streptomyces populi]